MNAAEKLKPEFYYHVRFKVIDLWNRTPDTFINDDFLSDPKLIDGKWVNVGVHQYDGYVWQNLGKIKNESLWYTKCLDITRYYDKIWTDLEKRDYAFTLIFNNEPQGDGVCVPLKDFEIYLLHNGYTIISYDKMNAFTPGFSIFGSSKIGNAVQNACGVGYSRYYKKGTKTLYFAFGFQCGETKIQFYYRCSENTNFTYQTPFRKEDFEAAEKLQVKHY